MKTITTPLQTMNHGNGHVNGGFALPPASAPLSPNSNSSAASKLFIGGLSYETTDESLGKYFSQFGPLSSAVVMRDQDTNRSRGFGFVTFHEPVHAQLALNTHHHVVDGRKVESKFAVPRRKTDSLESEDMMNDPTGLANLAPPTPTGASMQHAKMMNQHQQQQPPPNNMIVSNMIPHQNGVMGPMIGAMRATPTPSSTRSSPMMFSPNTTTTSTTTAGRSGESGSPPPNSDIIMNKIFVGGLRYATTHEVLRNYFEQFGEVETAQVIFNRDTKKSRGFGFVVFKDFSSVDRVLVHQRTSPPTIDGKQVEVKTCVARSEPSGSLSGSPRAVPHTPIVTRSESYSSLASTSSSLPPHQRSVSATPVRPGSVFPPPPYMQGGGNQTIGRDWSGVGSPTGFEMNEHMSIGNHLGQTDRRPSFASSSVRSSSPFTSMAPVYPTNGLEHLEPPNSQYVNQSSYARDSPSVHLGAGQRVQNFQSQPSQQQQPPRGRDDFAGDRFNGAFTSFANQQQMQPQHQAMPQHQQLYPQQQPQQQQQRAFQQVAQQSSYPRESAFSVPAMSNVHQQQHGSNGGAMHDMNPDMGLFDMTAFAYEPTGGFNRSGSSNNAGDQANQSTFRRQIQESPTPMSMSGNNNGSSPFFRPVNLPPASINPPLVSPAKLVVAKSPLLDPFSSFSPSKPIW